MPIQILPLNIPGEEMTQIVEDTVRELLAELGPESELVYMDGIFPGTKTISAPERLAGYYAMTPDLSDLNKLFDDNYLTRLREGLDAPPVNPYWLNAMSLPGTYDRLRRDFQKLIMQREQPLVRDPNRASY